MEYYIIIGLPTNIAYPPRRRDAVPREVLIACHIIDTSITSDTLIIYYKLKYI